MNDQFYLDFENKFRGSRDLIKERLKVYLPFVNRLAEIYKRGKVFDIGCGRGEWLELMSESGFEAYGCDIEEGMLKDCYERGLPASKKDGISFLKSLPDESHVIISAFHVIEHISFDDLRILVSESLRILKPGGLLILETPNSENIIVGTNNFYFDPTHKRPIPSLLLSYLPEYYGFKRSKLLRLQESPELAFSDKVKLIDIFRGVSQDIAVVAQKNTTIEIMDLFNQIFDKNYGLTLNDLTERYDAIIDQKIDFVSKELQSVYKSKEELSKELQSVYNGKSWRITAPLRFTMKMIRLSLKIPTKIIKSSIKLLKALLKKIIVPLIDFVIKRPSIKRIAKKIIDRFPSLKERLKSIAISSGILEVQGRILKNSNEDKAVSVEVSDLPPQAQKIYSDLKKAIEDKK